MFVSCDCRVLSGRGLGDEPIPRPQESHHVCHWAWSCATITLYSMRR